MTVSSTKCTILVTCPCSVMGVTSIREGASLVRSRVSAFVLAMSEALAFEVEAMAVGEVVVVVESLSVFEE